MLFKKTCLKIDLHMITAPKTVSAVYKIFMAPNQNRF